MSIHALFTADAAPVQAGAFRLPPLSLKVIHISDPHRRERRRVEAFVEKTYAKAYGGRIPGHYPTLMSVQDCDGRIYAAVGFRTGDEASLFLEQYLDLPVEQAVEAALGKALSRKMIVEIGNLASNGRGASVLLFNALARYLRGRGCEIAVATATRDLRRLFERAGFPTAELARADAGRLPDAGVSWGSYYEREPRVLAGSIGEALSPLEQFAARASARPKVRTRLHFRDEAPE